MNNYNQSMINFYSKNQNQNQNQKGSGIVDIVKGVSMIATPAYKIANALGYVDDITQYLPLNKKNHPNQQPLRSGEKHYYPLKVADTTDIRKNYALPNYLGPNTKLIDRLNAGHKPISAVDGAALIHDAQFLLSKGNPEKMREADLRFVKKLDEFEKSGKDYYHNTILPKAAITTKMIGEDRGVFDTKTFTKIKPNPDLVDIRLAKENIKKYEQLGYGKEESDEEPTIENDRKQLRKIEEKQLKKIVNRTPDIINIMKQQLKDHPFFNNKLNELSKNPKREKELKTKIKNMKHNYTRIKDEILNFLLENEKLNKEQMLKFQAELLKAIMKTYAKVNEIPIKQVKQVKEIITLEPHPDDVLIDDIQLGQGLFSDEWSGLKSLSFLNSFVKIPSGIESLDKIPSGIKSLDKIPSGIESLHKTQGIEIAKIKDLANKLMTGMGYQKEGTKYIKK